MKGKTMKNRTTGVKAKVLALACAAGLAGFASAATINDVRTDVVPGEWTSSFSAAKTYAEAQEVPLIVFFASSGCSHCNKIKEAINTSKFVQWRKSRKMIMVAVDDNATVKNFAKGAARWLQSEKTGKFPYVRIYWPAGGVDCGFNGYPYAGIPGSGSEIEDKLISCFDNQLAKWVSGGGDPGSGTGGDPSPTPAPAPTIGSEWKKARTLNGSYYAKDGSLAGRISVAAGKVNAKGQASIKATITGFDGRNKTTRTAKVSVNKTTTGTLTGAMGTYAFSITGSKISGTLTMGSVNYNVTDAATGGYLPDDALYFVLEDYPETCEGYPIINGTDYLPLSVAFTTKSSKWYFPKKKTLSYDRKTKAFTMKPTSNPSGLKLSYKYKTGYFTGNFTIYALRSPTATTAKRYTAKVTGFMVGSSGEGIATINKVGTYPCTISPTENLAAE